MSLSLEFFTIGRDCSTLETYIWELQLKSLLCCLIQEAAGPGFQISILNVLKKANQTSISKVSLSQRQVQPIKLMVRQHLSNMGKATSKAASLMINVKLALLHHIVIHSIISSL